MSPARRRLHQVNAASSQRTRLTYTGTPARASTGAPGIPHPTTASTVPSTLHGTQAPHPPVPFASAAPPTPGDAAAAGQSAAVAPGEASAAAVPAAACAAYELSRDGRGLSHMGVCNLVAALLWESYFGL